MLPKKSHTNKGLCLQETSLKEQQEEELVEALPH
jgi:hypothetical protein